MFGYYLGHRDSEKQYFNTKRSRLFAVSAKENITILKSSFTKSGYACHDLVS